MIFLLGRCYTQGLPWSGTSTLCHRKQDPTYPESEGFGSRSTRGPVSSDQEGRRYQKTLGEEQEGIVRYCLLPDISSKRRYGYSFRVNNCEIWRVALIDHTMFLRERLFSKSRQGVVATRICNLREGDVFTTGMVLMQYVPPGAKCPFIGGMTPSPNIPLASGRLAFQ